MFWLSKPNLINFGNKVLGVDLLATKFKRREDFKSDLEYKDYLINTMKPDMLVVCNKSSDWKPASGYYRRSHPRPMRIDFQ